MGYKLKKEFLMKKIITPAIFALISTSTFAASLQNGISVEALGGWSFAQSPSGQEIGAPKKNDNYTWGGDVSFNYVLNAKMLGSFEVGYLNFGKVKYGQPADVNVNNNGIQALAGISYYFNKFYVFAKGGAIYQNMGFNYSAGQYSGLELSISKWLPVAAGGFGYVLQPNLNLSLQYERTFGSNMNHIGESNLNNLPKPMTQNAVMLGVSYNFSIK
jgi:Outer membrane protein beta-barrel domain